MDFQAEIDGLRARYENKRFKVSNLYPGCEILHETTTMDNSVERWAYWMDNGGGLGRYVCLSNLPGTLSGDILRLRRNLPDTLNNWDIDGNSITKIEKAPIPGAEEVFPEDSDHTTSDLHKLPLVNVDIAEHFVKRCNYQREILNLIKCQGGSCPGLQSPSLVPLLGKSVDAELVFKRLIPWQEVIHRSNSLERYKAWLLQLIEGLQLLHSYGIIHRDLSLKNIMFSKNDHDLILIDLESRWGTWQAPELSKTMKEAELDDAGWSKETDIYDIGPLIKGLVYANVPINPLVDWPVPAQLNVIVTACMMEKPEQRPTLAELRTMVLQIGTE